MVRFTMIPIFIGVFVSPAARKIVPKMMVAVRSSIGVYKIKKYVEAVSRIPSFTCIQTGICPLSPKVAAVKTEPTTRTIMTACPTARFARSRSPAPSDLAIYARNPILSAEIELLISQFTVVVAPTAAVAWVPSEPTIAVSIYWTAVCISCSSIVGQARLIIIKNILSTCFADFFCINKTSHPSIIASFHYTDS